MNKSGIIIVSLVALAGSAWSQGGNTFHQQNFSNEQFSNPKIEYGSGELRDPITNPPPPQYMQPGPGDSDFGFDVYDYDYYPETFDQYDGDYEAFESEYDSGFDQDYEDYDYYNSPDNDFGEGYELNQQLNPMDPIEDF